MLTLEDHEKINQFKDRIHRHHFVDTQYDAFRKHACCALQEIFGYKNIIFGYLDMLPAKAYDLNILVHNLKTKYIEKFFMSGVLSEKELKEEDNCVIFSKTSCYQKKRVCRDIMSEYGFKDFLVCFLPVDNLYDGYLILFQEKKLGKFVQKDKDIMNAINEYLAVEYFNYLKIIQLRNSNNMLRGHFNYYPIGVIMMTDIMTVSYANETAMEYLQELGISSLKFFSVFYNNHLVPHIKNDVFKQTGKNIIRYKNFIFNVVYNVPVTEDFFEEMAPAKSSEPFKNMLSHRQIDSGYVYIFRDEYSVFSKSSNYFEEYNFTPKEQQVAELLIMGNDTATISTKLNISVNTVKVHIQNLYRKSQVSNRAEFIFKMNNRV